MCLNKALCGCHSIPDGKHWEPQAVRLPALQTALSLKRHIFIVPHATEAVALAVAPVALLAGVSKQLKSLR
jgi:hypothetical protein